MGGHKINRLQLWRVNEGLSQSEAAARLGISRSTYSPIEAGRMTPTTGVAERLRDLFGEDADALLKPIKPRAAIPVLREAAPQ
jgi:transcriptional regulator with XRE-family HTH domain